MPQVEQEHLSVQEASRILFESRWTTQRRCRTGELPHVRVGKSYVIRRADVEALAAKRQAAS